MGRLILANLPPYPRPIMSDFDKPTYLPKDRTSYVDGPFFRNLQDLNYTHTLCIQIIEKNVNLVLCIEETEVKTKPQKDCTFW